VHLPKGLRSGDRQQRQPADRCHPATPKDALAVAASAHRTTIGATEGNGKTNV
jgi:hypothetical protein